MNVVTWNMQGAASDGENKWGTMAGRFFGLSSAADVVCLQESGRVPSSAELHAVVSRDPTGVRFWDPRTGHATVAIYTWQDTSRRPHYMIVHYEWDQSGRVNLAIVIQIPPNVAPLRPVVRLVWGRDERWAWRPALGVLWQGQWVYSFHAISPGGVDAVDVLLTLQAFAGTAWCVAGDFNLECDLLRQALAARSLRCAVCPPNMPTYPAWRANRRYDYLVRGGNTGATGMAMDSMPSDHLPVRFQF